MEKFYLEDQQILDERGIDLTVSQVVNLSSSEYSDRLRKLCLTQRDEAFVKRLRRRIKNRMASQNSRRRTAEHIKTLRCELRAVRARKQHAVEERRTLMRERDEVAGRCRELGRYILQRLSERKDSTPLPFDAELVTTARTDDRTIEGLVVKRLEKIYRYDKEECPPIESVLDFTTLKRKDLDKQAKDKAKLSDDENDTPIIDNIRNRMEEVKMFSNLKNKTDYNSDQTEHPKIVRAKCVAVDLPSDTDSFKKSKMDLSKVDVRSKIDLSNCDVDSLRKSEVEMSNFYKCEMDLLSFNKKESNLVNESLDRETNKRITRNGHIVADAVNTNFCDTLLSRLLVANREDSGALNLSLKCAPGESRRQHGRKQPAPRRIAHHVVCHDDDGVLDLKIRNCD